MNRTSLVALAAVFTFGAVALRAKPVTLTGTLSDELCETKHMMPNQDAAGCTRECIKHGADYILIVKDKIYTLKPDNRQAAADLDALAGTMVTMEGDTEADFIWVMTIKAAK